MADVTLNPVTPSTNGAIVSSTNPLPVSVTGNVAATSIPTVTWANLPTPGTAGTIRRVSNIGPKGSVWIDNGTRWVPTAGYVLLASLDTSSSAVDNAAEVIKLQTAALPAGFMQVGDWVRVYASAQKSGGTNAAQVNIRVGTLGTIGDGQINTSANALMGNANRTNGIINDFRIDSATTMFMLGNSNVAGSSGYGAASSSAVAAARTISNISGSLFISLGLLASGATDTIILQQAQIEYHTSAN